MYHIGFTSKQDLRTMFGDIRFVCLGGTAHRMEKFARLLVRELPVKLPTGCDLSDLSAHSHRYSMFKAGPVLCVNHGMGAPSVSILLHELFKLLHYAGCLQVTFIRMGTCGGLGVPPGTIVVSKEVINEFGEPNHTFSILGKREDRPCFLSQELAEEIISVGRRSYPSLSIISGKTMCTNDFYEGQARLDGAFCPYTMECKKAYLNELHNKNGVTNIEMESSLFSAMCHYANVPAAIVCVTLVERLKEDQIRDEGTVSLAAAQEMLQNVVLSYIKHKLQGQT